ncbi:uncharacterized protein si:dkey-10c21.1 [Puntigrus tetrazona]|uniref:uncharacterized protein si:dkey-10c21.1 n=1 Tax=Puntigrus tetrazona TaxID=1606681 RepID=UPI001C8A2965|nr:uncharacterized protein si:dkey-10c21.1 [Puntigrus tetrazona]XP_043103992.1 uncharacterized protein si:dkey-10c21.1 [Puntigrus tetrazona]
MEVILKNKPKLIKWLSSDFLIVLQHVQANGFVTMLQYNELKEIKAKDGVIKLLDIIVQRGENVCRDFLKLLKDDDVNEISPELRDWSKTVDIEDQQKEKDKGRAGLSMPIQETERMSRPSGTQVICNISASNGGSVNAPVITDGNHGSLVMNFGRPNVPENYQRPDRDHRTIHDYQMFLKENTSLLVQKVKSIEPIIDDLDLQDELAANVRAKPTDQDKMRKLLTYVNCESIAKDLFTALCEHEKRLMDELLKRY